MLLQFTPIALLKLKPFSGIVAEPLAQFGAGGDIFQLRVKAKRTFLYPARPQSLHQKSAAIIAGRRVVRTL